MDATRVKFIELATRGLDGNDEEERLGYAMLNEQIEGVDPAQLERAADALQKSLRPRKWLRRGLYLLVFVVSIPLLIQHGRNFLSGSRVVKTLTTSSVVESNTETELTQNLSESDKLILFGDRSKTTEAEQMKALWDSAPENPAYYIE